MTTSPARQLLRNHPVLAFFVLTYILTWALVLPFGLFFPPGCLLAALIVVGLTQGRAGFAELGRRMTRWRVGAAWYVLAVAVPVVVQLLTFGTNLALGAGTPTSVAQLAPLSVLGAFAVRLVNPLDGPLAEEPGWRAFAQPRVQIGRSRLAATLILAVLVACWHLPLWLLPSFGATPSVIVADVLGTVAVTIWYSWLFNHSGGSALLTLIAHSVEGLVHPQLFWSDPAVASKATSVYAAVWVLAALVLIVADREFWGDRSRLDDDTRPAATGSPDRSDPLSAHRARSERVPALGTRR
ncbi:CPBP family intramembrane glutamic endopeptidase [uncultured Friedmanniella sp.]|uniref:CPBP family intramembrane glutamic endopeptidase n=1 Tax=uncultured Friedmanniella sp. TaxID=335381 RepID=UPI0035CA14ED